MTDSPPEPGPRLMRLRYAGTCSICQVGLAAGTSASYDRARRTVTCAGCLVPAPRPAPVESPAPVPAVTGVAGASARREHERRRAARESRIRQGHPRIGGLMLALTDDPQSTKAWAVGAQGEELLARHLDKLTDRGVWVLHDRRIPGTRANIDHLAISAAGVFTIDAKNYTGRPDRLLEDSRSGTSTEKLIVDGRDRTRLISGVHHQVDVVRTHLETAGYASVPVTGIVCFVKADWPWIGAGFTITGVHVLPPRKLTSHLTGPPVLDEAPAIHAALTAHFPPA